MANRPRVSRMCDVDDKGTRGELAAKGQSRDASRECHGARERGHPYRLFRRMLGVSSRSREVLVFCPNCGTQNSETAQACAKCSFQLVAPGAAAGAPKFKGTMLMMNQPNPGFPSPQGGIAPAGSAPLSAGSGQGQASGFVAESPPMGAPNPSAPNRHKGTMVGVAPPNFNAAPPASSFGAQRGSPGDASGAPSHQTFGSAADANPLAGTMALDGPPAAFGAGGRGYEPPGYGAQPPAQPYGGFGPPPGADMYGAPPAAGGQPFNPFAGQSSDPIGNAVNQALGGPHDGYQPQGGYAPPGYAQPGYQPQAGYPQAGYPQADYPGAGAMQVGFPGAADMTGASGPPKQFIVALLLAIFAGSFGAHRFYTGHILFGVIQLFTFGGCGIWTLVDIFLIATGKYTDSKGRPLVKS